MPEPPQRRRGLGLPPNVVWLSVVSFLNDFSSEMIYPLLPFFFRVTLRASVPELGLMEGIAESTASLVRLGSGWLGDRMPRRKPLVVIGYGLASLVRPLMAAARSPWPVIGLRFTDRLGKGIRSAPRDALIADSVAPNQRGRAFGFHRALDHLGAIAGPLAAMAILAAAPGHYRLVFACAALPALASMAVLVLGVREAAVKREERGAGLAGAGGFGGPFWYLLATIFLFTLGNSSDLFLLMRARDRGIAEVWIPALWVLLHVVKSACSTPAGILSDRVPRRYLVIAGWATYAGVYLGFAVANAAWQIWLLFTLYGVYFGLVEGVEKAMVADLAPADARGTAFGWYNLAIGIGAFPASLIAGILWNSVSPAAALEFGAGLALAAAVMLTLGGRSISRRPALMR